jgi:hypothetical protein
VALDDDVVLEGADEYMVRGRVYKGESVLRDRVGRDKLQDEGVFIASNNLLGNQDILAANSLVNYSGEYVPVRVMTGKREKVILRKGTHLGDIQELNNEQGFVENIRSLHNVQLHER